MFRQYEREGHDSRESKLRLPWHGGVARVDLPQSQIGSLPYLGISAEDIPDAS